MNTRSRCEGSKAAFDRETGKPIQASELKTYAEALAQYHMRLEAKFLIGDFFDRGRTERRHVVASQIIHIGKEANKWEERYFLGDIDDSEVEYGIDHGHGTLDGNIRALTDQIGERWAAKQLGVSRTALRRALKCGAAAMSRSTRAQLARTAQSATERVRRPKRRRSLLLVITNMRRRRDRND